MLRRGTPRGNAARRVALCPPRLLTPTGVAKAYAVWAMHGSVMTKGFVGFVSATFGVTSGALYNCQTSVSEFARVLLSDHGKEVRAPAASLSCRRGAMPGSCQMSAYTWVSRSTLSPRSNQDTVKGREAPARCREGSAERYAYGQNARSSWRLHVIYG